MELGDLEGARRLQEASVASDRKLPDEHPDVVRARKNLAVTLSLLGRHEEAIDLETQVLAAQSRAMPDDHHDLQSTRTELLFAHFRRLAARRARSIASGGASPPEDDARVRELVDMLVADYARGLRSSAQSILADASSGAAEERMAHLARDADLLVSLVGGLGLVPPDAARERLVFVGLESLRSAALANARLARAAGADEECAALRKRVREASAELARLAQTGAPAERFDRVRTELGTAERELVRQATRTAGTKSGEPVEFDTLARLVREGEAIVAYRRYERHSVELSEPPRWSVSDDYCAFVLRGPAPAGSPAREPLVRVELGPGRRRSSPR